MGTPFQRRPNAKPRHSAGVAAVEFAIVLVVLMLIVAGIVEFGRALWYYDALAKGTRDAARYLSTIPASSLSAELANARRVVLESGEMARVPGLIEGHINARCDPASIAGCVSVQASAVDTVTVSVSYPMTIGDWIPFVPSGAGGETGFAVTLQPHTTMRYMW